MVIAIGLLMMYRSCLHHCRPLTCKKAESLLTTVFGFAEKLSANSQRAPCPSSTNLVMAARGPPCGDLKACTAQCRTKFQDHGSAAAGAWRGKSEILTPAPPSLMAEEFSGNTTESLQDHGGSAGGAWRNRSERADPLVITGKWWSEPPDSHDHRGDGGGRERSRHDHGSLVAGTAGTP